MRGLAGILALAGLIGSDAGAGELQVFPGSVLIPTDWADGDSFRVRVKRVGKEEEHTVRLYGVDCFEKGVSDENDRGRLRAQRGWFGISEFGGSVRSSERKALGLGVAGWNQVQQWMGGKALTIHTAFADGGGDGKYERIYAFVEFGEGKDLGEELVKAGLARAYGVARRRDARTSRDEYRERLKDLEMQAAKNGAGAWEWTDWSSLPDERSAERMIEEERKALAGRGAIEKELADRSIDPNTAARDQLMLLPGVGETLANRIVEGREDGRYTRVEDLIRIPGIGTANSKKFARYLRFGR